MGGGVGVEVETGEDVGVDDDVDFGVAFRGAIAT
jgi:hypothetical protein